MSPSDLSGGMSLFRNAQEYLEKQAALIVQRRQELHLEGLHQTFSEASPDTLIVTEYIHRYGGFTRYFTLSNVTALTGDTGRQ